MEKEYYENMENYIDDYEPEPSHHVIVADWEDMHNDYPYASPKQYGLEIFEGTYGECRDHLNWLRKNPYEHPYSNFDIEERY